MSSRLVPDRVEDYLSVRQRPRLWCKANTSVGCGKSFKRMMLFYHLLINTNALIGFRHYFIKLRIIIAWKRTWREKKMGKLKSKVGMKPWIVFSDRSLLFSLPLSKHPMISRSFEIQDVQEWTLTISSHCLWYAWRVQSTSLGLALKARYWRTFTSHYVVSYTTGTAQAWWGLFDSLSATLHLLESLKVYLKCHFFWWFPLVSHEVRFLLKVMLAVTVPPLQFICYTCSCITDLRVRLATPRNMDAPSSLGLMPMCPWNQVECLSHSKKGLGKKNLIIKQMKRVPQLFENWCALMYSCQ